MSISYNKYQKRMQDAYSSFEKKLKAISIESALRMESSAKENATGFPRVRTGRLRSSIKGLVKKEGDNLTILVKAGNTSEVNYAGYVEFGTSRMEPRYYLRRAVEKEKKRVVPVLGEIIKQALLGK